MVIFTVTEFPGKQREKIVGVVKDGDLIGTIYPTEEGIEVVPNHLMTRPEQIIKTSHNRDQNTLSILINLIK